MELEAMTTSRTRPVKGRPGRSRTATRPSATGATLSAPTGARRQPRGSAHLVSL